MKERLTVHEAMDEIEKIAALARTEPTDDERMAIMAILLSPRGPEEVVSGGCFTAQELGSSFAHYLDSYLRHTGAELAPHSFCECIDTMLKELGFQQYSFDGDTSVSIADRRRWPWKRSHTYRQ